MPALDMCHAILIKKRRLSRPTPQPIHPPLRVHPAWPLPLHPLPVLRLRPSFLQPQLFKKNIRRIKYAASIPGSRARHAAEARDLR